MGFATVFASLAFIFIFASMIVFSATIQRNISLAAVSDTEQEDRARKLSESTIAIDAVEYTETTTTPWVDNLYREFLAGTTSGTNVSGAGSIILDSEPFTSGTYTSQVIDSGYSTTNYTTLSWTSVEPLGTTISFQVRGANTTAALAGEAFSGPAGTAGDYYTSSGTVLNETLNQRRYIQYRAYLDTSDNTQTPELQAVRLNIRRPVGHIFVNVTNTGSESLDPTHTDIYVGGTRVARNTTYRTITHDDQGEQALWNPGEQLSITAFRTLSSSSTVTVANSIAKDSTTITP
jgi:archaellum component FlaF (FlaF/FlaG flagellin family)